MGFFFSSMFGASQPKPEAFFTKQQLSAPAKTAGVAVTLPNEHPFMYDIFNDTKKVWRVFLKFKSDPETRTKEIPEAHLSHGWVTELVILAKDIVGLMQEGLYVTENNVQVLESSFKDRWRPEKNAWYTDRHYTLKDPKWTGKLLV
ncbi:hypothetical protein F53441_6572 [Fusarium austroafricanum]|uniref:Uncharacterized protein n=1 Tax=Fusarium austroafricanum TaxID=2364996 RepID=A0A8H4KIF7_9HYPO|nr:hypothetical protein F53441_6572 [Fusarium austroafricanum]